MQLYIIIIIVQLNKFIMDLLDAKIVHMFDSYKLYTHMLMHMYVLKCLLMHSAEGHTHAVSCTLRYTMYTFSDVMLSYIYMTF